MAEVRPFRGTRYNPEAIGDLSLVVAPPYDVISDEGRDAFYNKHPYNVVRLILNRPKRNDPDPEQPYRRAADFIDRWTAQRILITDTSPGIYLYRQRYLLEGQYKECTGLVARVRLEEFSAGGILPHEEIMPRPFADRMKLLERTRMNLDLIQTLYSDPTERLKDPILAELERFPAAQFQTGDGVAHDLWAVTEDRFVTKMSTFFKGKPLYIADGHHRYQTSLEYSLRLRESGEIADDDDPRNFMMMMIVEMENPGLTVLPVHRVVLSPGVDVARLLSDLSRWFAVEEVEVPKGARSGQVYHLLKLLRERPGPAFGAFLGDERFALLTPGEGLDVVSEAGGGSPSSHAGLDVTVLQKLVFERTLGIAADRESVESTLCFTRDPLEAVGMVDSGAASYVFFVNPTPVEQVREVADDGEKMPQKSTYFYPKPFSGVVMNRITEW
ncbi:MAG: DUF1015 domain-containing protein [Actinobacteria bacterium]|nr:DUF1015 domain-containing protein [Actinomycetota bacterium]